MNPRAHTQRLSGDPVYLGIAPVHRDAEGREIVRRADLRFAPEFGGRALNESEEDSMSNDGMGYWELDEDGTDDLGFEEVIGDDDEADENLSSDSFDDEDDDDDESSYDDEDDDEGAEGPDFDPTGLFATPDEAPWTERMAWATDDLNVDNEAVADTDADYVDDVNEPGGYNTLVAGEFGASPFQKSKYTGTRSPGQKWHSGKAPAVRGKSAGPDYKGSSKGQWTKTLVAAATADVTVLAIGVTATLQATLQVRPQHSFMAQDTIVDTNVAIGGVSPNGHTFVGGVINSIAFGDRTVFNPPVGVPIQVFASNAAVLGNSFLRGIIKGAKIRGGLDILIPVTWQVTGGAVLANDIQLTVIITGLKPQTTEM